MGCLILLVWLPLWLVAGHPYLLGEWNPWNVSLLVMAALGAVGSVGYHQNGTHRQ